MNVINDDDEEKKNANGWFHNGVQDHQSWSHNWKKKEACFHSGPHAYD